MARIVVSVASGGAGAWCDDEKDYERIYSSTATCSNFGRVVLAGNRRLGDSTAASLELAGYKSMAHVLMFLCSRANNAGCGRITAQHFFIAPHTF